MEKKEWGRCQPTNPRPTDGAKIEKERRRQRFAIDHYNGPNYCRPEDLTTSSLFSRPENFHKFILQY